MKFEHAAVSANSIEESDKFFNELLRMEKTREFTVNRDLAQQFFGVDKDIVLIRYEKENVSFEVVIDECRDTAKDIFTHICLVIENIEKVIEKAISLGFKVIEVPRKDGKGFYRFIRDEFGNLYEIKS